MGNEDDLLSAVVRRARDRRTRESVPMVPPAGASASEHLLPECQLEEGPGQQSIPLLRLLQLLEPMGSP